MKTPAIKKAWEIISTVLVILVVLFALMLVGARLIGLNVYTVISGSMEPTYSVGDLIYVKKVAPESIRVGDPITFVMNEDLVVATHRVVAVDAANQRFTTKGDANEVEDAAPVHFNNLIGKPVFALPLLGFVSNWVQNPPGIYIAVVGGTALLLAVFLPDIVSGFRKKEPEETAESEEGTR